MAKVKTVKSYCNECLQHTNHQVLASQAREFAGTAPDGSRMFLEKIEYDFVQCRGCENVSLRRTFSGDPYPDGSVDYFPPAVSRRKPTWFSNPSFWAIKGPKAEIRSLLGEIYSAMFSGNMRLALMGTRAVVDVALTDRLDDIGGFEKKLARAKEKGWITESQHKVLGVVIDAGSAAAHRAHQPTKEQMGLVLDVVEHVIQLLYILDSTADKISRQTPKRTPAAAK